ncbi:MAG TPA: alpha-L-glutamate ligase [Anaeromyxobacter sp.]|nr:alpha-L-glutamate ligase [Anaeromyxobacter sp.]
MILAVSHAGDDHLAPVLEALARLGVEARVFDVGDFPARLRLAFAARARVSAWILDGPDGRAREQDLSAVWWRRPRPVELAPNSTPHDRALALRQANATVVGLWASLRVRWVNEPWADDAASHKPRQLAAAVRAGLPVPRTLVTNDPDRARGFLRGLGRTRAVWKALHCTPEDWYPTRLLGPRSRPDLASLRDAPAILQAYVPGMDVRVTAVGGRLFAAEIDARRTRSPHDFRPVFDEARVARCTLPAGIARRLRALLADLGLAYAAVDLRRRENGEHVFLEVNPSGQFRFVEERTGLPITGALAELLAGR